MENHLWMRCWYQIKIGGVLKMLTISLWKLFILTWRVQFSHCAHIQNKVQNILRIFTVTLSCGDLAIGSQISQLVYIIWQSHFSLHDKKSHQYHPIRKYFNNAINNDDIKLFTTSLFIIVDVLRCVNIIEFHGWPWKTIWLLQNVIDKKSQQHFGYLSRKMFLNNTVNNDSIKWITRLVA